MGNTGAARTESGRVAVHPHACGEHQGKRPPQALFVGSSPRMWGTRRKAADRRFQTRFIPTHVGNTLEDAGYSMILSVHPHACGEHRIRSRSLDHDDGSSPRMWGTLTNPSSTVDRDRFIPTHVGNTSGGGWANRPSTVHPHACGEHLTDSISASTSNGSSPRMWGTLVEECGEVLFLRFIPTHVGNTSTMNDAADGSTVHPHACGEHSISHLGASL